MLLSRKIYLAIFLLSAAMLTAGCSATKRELPPLLAEDELIRPFVNLGRIQVTREVYFFADYMLSPDIREWGYQAVREEAAKMGADAVILPEISGNTLTFTLLPSTEYRATGVAVKFK